MEEGGGEDMRFMLPGCPSPALLAALLAASRELDRAGKPRRSHLECRLRWQMTTSQAACMLWPFDSQSSYHLWYHISQKQL